MTCVGYGPLNSTLGTIAMRIEDHKLAWRWTDPAYAVLPGEVLAQMHPATQAEANASHVRSLSFLGTDGLNATLQPTVIFTEELSPEAGANWLRQQHPYPDEPVWLSWEPSCALRTTWGIFLSYWPEFCYPSSDDLIVFPESEAWALLFHHEQEFHFGRRSVNA